VRASSRVKDGANVSTREHLVVGGYATMFGRSLGHAVSPIRARYVWTRHRPCGFQQNKKECGEDGSRTTGVAANFRESFIRP